MLIKAAEVREAYVQGLVQRRVKYRIDLDREMPIEAWAARYGSEVAKTLEERWGATFCPSGVLPTLGLLLVHWRGGHLLADVSLCAPVSHPSPPPAALRAPVRRIDICVEPVAPLVPPAGYVTIHTPGVKMLGRITLRRNYAVVKHRGLLFVTAASYSPEERGGVALRLARYLCHSYDVGKAFRKIRAVLRSRAW